MMGLLLELVESPVMAAHLIFLSAAIGSKNILETSRAY